MDTNNSKGPWYKSKLFLVPLGILGLVGFLNVSNAPTQVAEPQVLPAVQVQQQKKPIETQMLSGYVPVEQTTQPVKVQESTATLSEVKTSSPTQTVPETTTLSNNNYYTNTAGNTVHSPAYSSSGVPAGASAQCRDGTYSFSQSRRGTCSHHGGVAEWY